MSYGTFEAELLPLKNSLVIMENSLIAPDPNEDPWPNN
jgi:hypothetical protein